MIPRTKGKSRSKYTCEIYIMNWSYSNKVEIVFAMYQRMILKGTSWAGTFLHPILIKLVQFNPYTFFIVYEIICGYEYIGMFNHSSCLQPCSILTRSSLLRTSLPGYFPFISLSVYYNWTFTVSIPPPLFRLSSSNQFNTN